MGGAEGALSATYAANAASCSSCRLVYLFTTISSQLLQQGRTQGSGGWHAGSDGLLGRGASCVDASTQWASTTAQLAHLNSMPTKCARMVFVQACRQQQGSSHAAFGQAGRVVEAAGRTVLAAATSKHAVGSTQLRTPPHPTHLHAEHVKGDGWGGHPLPVDAAIHPSAGAAQRLGHQATHNRLRGGRQSSGLWGGQRAQSSIRACASKGMAPCAGLRLPCQPAPSAVLRPPARPPTPAAR